MNYMQKVEGGESEEEGKNTESDEEFSNLQYKIQKVPQKQVTLNEIQMKKQLAELEFLKSSNLIPNETMNNIS